MTGELSKFAAARARNMYKLCQQTFTKSWFKSMPTMNCPFTSAIKLAAYNPNI